MDRQEFYYDFPDKLIAQHPLKKRDAAKLMVIDRVSGEIIHSRFSELEKYLPQKSMLVVNDSKVIPARLFGKKERSGGNVEIFLLKKLADGYTYETLIRPLKKVRDGDKIIFSGSRLNAVILDAKSRLVKFNFKNIMPHINQVGHIPLPPYIKREDTPADRKDYQTVYANQSGSVAAPTAGLHFTKKHLADLATAGHDIAKVTLHVNFATFQLVEERDIKLHKMHFEEYKISLAVLKKIQNKKIAEQKVIAIGTTSCRVLEAVAGSGILKGETNLFIYPGYSFKAVDGLLTNFHFPYSSLLMLAFAFGGTELMKRAYQEAVKKEYRFFSYGDAMLII